METLLSVIMFAGAGALFVWFNFAMGALIRPKLPNAVKSAAYECGEPTVGSSRVQFDVRFYIIGLVFLLFDVEVALLYPWAVVYGNAVEAARSMGVTVFELRSAALIDMFIFFGLLLVGFAYLWRFGYLEWVRSSTSVANQDRGNLSPIDESPGIIPH